MGNDFQAFVDDSDFKHPKIKWKSPIEIHMQDEPMIRDMRVLQERLTGEIETYTVQYVNKIGIKVDRDELLKALRYDRGQYQKGFRDGMQASKMSAAQLLDALDYVTWYNNIGEEVYSWKDLPINTDYGKTVIKCPGRPWQRQDLEMIWMIAVVLFGNYGTSPRGGWIEDVAGFQGFIRSITKTWRNDVNED